MDRISVYQRQRRACSVRIHGLLRAPNYDMRYGAFRCELAYVGKWLRGEIASAICSDLAETVIRYMISQQVENWQGREGASAATSYSFRTIDDVSRIATSLSQPRRGRVGRATIFSYLRLRPGSDPIVRLPYGDHRITQTDIDGFRRVGDMMSTRTDNRGVMVTAADVLRGGIHPYAG